MRLGRFNRFNVSHHSLDWWFARARTLIEKPQIESFNDIGETDRTTINEFLQLRDDFLLLTMGESFHTNRKSFCAWSMNSRDRFFLARLAFGRDLLIKRQSQASDTNACGDHGCITVCMRMSPHALNDRIEIDEERIPCAKCERIKYMKLTLMIIDALEHLRNARGWRNGFRCELVAEFRRHIVQCNRYRRIRQSGRCRKCSRWFCCCRRRSGGRRCGCSCRCWRWRSGSSRWLGWHRRCRCDRRSFWGGCRSCCRRTWSHWSSWCCRWLGRLCRRRLPRRSRTRGQQLDRCVRDINPGARSWGMRAQRNGRRWNRRGWFWFWFRCSCRRMHRRRVFTAAGWRCVAMRHVQFRDCCAERWTFRLTDFNKRRLFEQIIEIAEILHCCVKRILIAFSWGGLCRCGRRSGRGGAGRLGRGGSSRCNFIRHSRRWRQSRYFCRFRFNRRKRRRWLCYRPSCWESRGWLWNRKM